MLRRVALLTAAATLLTAAPGEARSRYAPANGCFAVGQPLFFKPTRLGSYLLQARDGTLVGGEAPGPATEWTARRAGRGLSLRNTATKRYLARDGSESAAPVALALPRAEGCRPYPEAALGAKGRSFRGTRKDGSVRGFADAHFHPVADLRAGGQVISGEAFDRFGITAALGRDAEVHGADGSGDLTGNLLRGDGPTDPHDIHGWPSFTGWPTYDTNTHQQLYYRWLQRAWLAGLRLTVAQIVEDEPLCNIEPKKSHSCDETATIELAVKRLRGLQDYIDAQAGGPGRGWLRLVYSPAQARKVIARGKLAMVLGVEASNPFGCSQRLDVPQCDAADVDAGVRLYDHLGIRALFVTHWVDNAFGGAALEGGDKGTFIATFQLSQTGEPFTAGACPEEGEGEEMPPAPGRQCNTQGLTPLGEQAITKLIDAHMLIEADHLSEQTRRDVFAIAEARGYPLLSSHNGTGGHWVDSQLDRLHADGGYVGATLGEPNELAAKVAALGRHGFTGVGLGSDTGGFNSLPAPQPGQPRLAYPFRSYRGDVTLGRQRTGTRAFDLNADGMAHYGLLPDLLARVQRVGGGKRALRLLFGGAEAYLRTWERALAS